MGQFSLTSFGVVRIGNASAYKTELPDLQFELLAAGDLNKDGFDDLVLGARFASDPLVGGDNKIVVLFFDPLTRTFRLNQSVQDALEYSYYPRRAAIADFDGDGLNDLFIADHGPDEGSRVGFANRLYLQKSGGLQNAPITGGELKDFSHGILVDDFNRDGIKDILVLNSLLNRVPLGSTSTSYVVTVNGDGLANRQLLQIDEGREFWFSVDAPGNLEVPLGVKEQFGDFLSGTTADLNKDGLPDLILARGNGLAAHGSLVVYLSTGVGTYGKATSIPAPEQYKVYLESLTEARHLLFPTEVVAYDLDGDGEMELVAAYSYGNPQTGRWEGLFLQALKRTQDGGWSDVTDSVISNQRLYQSANSRWPHSFIKKLDLNGDGISDLVLTSSAGDTVAKGEPATYWVFDQGQFSVWSPPGVERINDTGTWPTPIDLGGKTFVVTLGYKWSKELNSYLDEQEYISVHGWEVGATDRQVMLGARQSVVEGTTGSDRFRSIAGETHFEGKDGIDQVRYYGAKHLYEVALTPLGVIVKAPVATELPFSYLQLQDGLDTLVSVERLMFYDVSLAVDVDGNAGITAKILGAVFGKESVQNKEYVGIGLHLLDNGMSYSELAGLAVRAAKLSGADQIVSALWLNVVGTSATDADKAPYVALLENGMPPGELAMLAAETTLNAVNIDLVGLSLVGIEYLPVA